MYPRSCQIRRDDEPVVITGIGLLASVGMHREAVWEAVRQGRSGARWLTGLEGIPDGALIGAPVDLEATPPGRLRATEFLERTSDEALADSGVDLRRVDRTRFGVSVSAQFADTSCIGMVGTERFEGRDGWFPWFHQFLPNVGCAEVGRRYGLHGPRLCHTAACASGIVSILAAVRMIRDGKCDAMLAGSAEAINPLMAAGFNAMRVLAQHDDPQRAARPFDAQRTGFIMGEGAAMFVLERLGHALRRDAPIYAEIAGGKLLAEAHHVTGLDMEASGLKYLIDQTLDEAGMAPGDVSYINAHGTGTQQNDVAETRGIRRAFGRVADSIPVSSVKSMLGHLVNAAGSVELAITALALRDGFMPPTINLTDPDPQCDLDCVPLVGRIRPLDTALKLSVAFGGHLSAVALRRWPEAQAGVDVLRRAA